MHELERLNGLLDKCKLEGCTQDDVRKLGMDHITGGSGTSSGNNKENNQPEPEG